MFRLLNGRECFFQWDNNQKLIVEDTSINQVHFCNRTDDCSLVCETYVEDGLTLVNVPNILLTTDAVIRAYAYKTDHTVIEKRFKVCSRTKPADYAYTETEVLNWHTMDSKVNEAIEEMNEVKEEGLYTIREAQDILTGASMETYYLQENNKKAEALIETVDNEVARLGTNNTKAEELLSEMNEAIQRSELASDQAVHYAGAADEAAQRATEMADFANTSAGAARDATYNANMAADETRSVLEEAKNILTSATAATYEAIQKTEEAVEATDKANAAANRVDAALNTVSNALVGEASGAIVSIKDVSPVEHKMDVKVSSKNLFDPTEIEKAIKDAATKGGYEYLTADGYYQTTANALYNKFHASKKNSLYDNFEPNTQYTFTVKGYSKEKTKTAGFYFVYADSSIANTLAYLQTTSEDVLKITSATGQTVVGLHCSEWNNDTVFLKDFQLEKNITNTDYTPYVDNIEDVKLYRTGKNLAKINNYELTGNETANLKKAPIIYEGYLPVKSILSFGKGFERINAAAFIQVQDEQGNALTNLGIAADATDYVELKLNAYGEKVKIKIVNFFKATGTISNIQLELGTVATEYEPSIEPVEVDKDEVVSLYPTTTLYSDTTGVKVEAKYNRDLNKAFEELYNAIISTGGNV